MNKMDEQIVVAPRARVFGDTDVHGLVTARHPRLREILAGMSQEVTLKRRGDVEDDPSFLQPIPYLILTRQREASAPIEVFAYERLAAGGEKRLEGKRSIGVGGHLNLLYDEQTFEEVMLAEAHRELREELYLRNQDGSEAPEPEIRFLGLLYDGTDAVGQVHIGVLLNATIPSNVQVAVRETDQLDGQWYDASDLWHNYGERLEKWSRHALKALPLT